MKRSSAVLLACSVGALGCVQTVVAQPRHAASDDARQSLVAIADSLHTFDAYDCAYNRWSRLSLWPRTIGADPSSDARANLYSQMNACVRLNETDYSSEVLTRLLFDTSPRVRTLAMVLLFAKEDPKLLTPVAQVLLSDTAPTFPVLLPTDNADPRATAAQTVGHIAEELLGIYLDAAGMEGWRNPTLNDWITYTSRHQNRAYSLSWLTVRLCRIAGMQSPFREERRPMLLDFRKALDKLPADDRNLYLLWLCHGADHDFDGGKVLATEAELVDAAQQLGRQKLLQIVDGRPPGTDPDLPATQEWKSRFKYRQVVSFLLAHADRLFTRADEPFLAAIEQGQRDKINRSGREDLEIISVEALGRARGMLLGPAR